ncbi:hypothetical protein PQX77_006649 [Marasmius sp. AFHP31]|nr:hypothetical protein PQX77_006649 [Marasmius sp. AFHP31]
MPAAPSDDPMPTGLNANGKCPRDLSEGNGEETLGRGQRICMPRKLTDLGYDLRDAAGYATGTGWNSADGVLDPRKFPPATGLVHNANQFSQNLIRSYFELALGGEASDLRTYLRAYLGVQYDSLVKQATFPSGAPHFYGVDLRPEPQLSLEAQIRAITTLLGGVISGDATSPSNTEEHSRAPTGAIVGGVVGGVLGLALIFAGGYYYLLRRPQSQSQLTVEPFSAVASMPLISNSSSFQSEKYTKQAPLENPCITRTLSAQTPLAPEESQPSCVQEPTTAELVTMLNQRLRNEIWDADECPPEYPSSEVP